MTNVRNKRADSESTLSLQPRANGLIKSFDRRQTVNPLLLYLDRDCLLFIKASTSGSKLKALLASWLQKLSDKTFPITRGAKCQRKSEPLKRESTNNHTIFIQTLNSFATFLVLLVFASLLHAWVHFLFIVYIVLCIKSFFFHITYLTLLVTFTLVLC